MCVRTSVPPRGCTLTTVTMLWPHGGFSHSKAHVPWCWHGPNSFNIWVLHCVWFFQRANMHICCGQFSFGFWSSMSCSFTQGFHSTLAQPRVLVRHDRGPATPVATLRQTKQGLRDEIHHLPSTPRPGREARATKSCRCALEAKSFSVDCKRGPHGVSVHNRFFAFCTTRRATSPNPLDLQAARAEDCRELHLEGREIAEVAESR